MRGTINLDGDQDVDIKGSAKDVRIEDILPNFTDIPMTGWIHTDVHIEGTLQRPKVNGYVKAWDGSIYGKLFESIEGYYAYKDGHLHLPRLDIYYLWFLYCGRWGYTKQTVRYLIL